MQCENELKYWDGVGPGRPAPEPAPAQLEAVLTEVRRLEEDLVTADQSCRHAEAELCGPANCKFVNVTLECHEKTSSVTAELRRRECTVCEPRLADTVEVGVI